MRADLQLSHLHFTYQLNNLLLCKGSTFSWSIHQLAEMQTVLVCCFGEGNSNEHGQASVSAGKCRVLWMQLCAMQNIARSWAESGNSYCIIDVKKSVLFHKKLHNPLKAWTNSRRREDHGNMAKTAVNIQQRQTGKGKQNQRSYQVISCLTF